MSTGADRMLEYRTVELLNEFRRGLNLFVADRFSLERFCYEPSSEGRFLAHFEHIDGRSGKLSTSAVILESGEVYGVLLSGVRVLAELLVERFTEAEAELRKLVSGCGGE